jgi:hypothetical protein
MSKVLSVKPSLVTVAALVATTALLSVPVASADTPVGPGGCNMLAASGPGLDHMMAGSSGSQNGIGATNMFQMLQSFYPQAPFCGLGS